MVLSYNMIYMISILEWCNEMTLVDSRKALFNCELNLLSYDKKEWKKLTLVSIGISKYENLLLQFDVSDSLWNIVIDYISVDIPHHQHARIYPGQIGYYDRTCMKCSKKSGQLIMMSSEINPSVRSDIKKYYTVVCYPCVYKIIPDEINVMMMIKYLECYYNLKMSLLPSKWLNIITWLGCADYEYISLL
jgi:hypothetical protein